MLIYTDSENAPAYLSFVVGEGKTKEAGYCGLVAADKDFKTQMF